MARPVRDLQTGRATSTGPTAAVAADHRSAAAIGRRLVKAAWHANDQGDPHRRNRHARIRRRRDDGGKPYALTIRPTSAGERGTEPARGPPTARTGRAVRPRARAGRMPPARGPPAASCHHGVRTRKQEGAREHQQAQCEPQAAREAEHLPGRSDSYAVVTKTGPPVMTGEECPVPGIGVFQRTCSVADQRSGACAARPTPCRSCPRNPGQPSPARRSNRGAGDQ